MITSTARRYLVVVDHTLGGTALTSTVNSHAAEGAQIHVLAPTEEGELSIGQATGRLRAELKRLDAAGIEATGAVATAEPLDAVRHALDQDTYDGVIIATPPLGMSKLLHRDLPHKVQREFKMPVEWIESRTDDAGEDTTVNIRLPKAATRSM